MKVLDAFGVPDPASLVRDVDALQAEGIGGYAYDDDVLSANPWTGAHVDAVRAAGKAFLPIITLRTSSPTDVATLGAALRALNCHSGPVGWDVENTATPPYATLQTLVARLRALGYGPMTGYFWPPLTWRPVYGDLFDFHWWGSGGAVPAIPPGWNAIQYGQEVANGTAYDVNIFDPAIFAAPAPAPMEEEEEVILFGVGAPGIYLLSGSLYVHVTDPADVQEMQANGVKFVDGISAGTHAALLAGSQALQGKVTGTLSVSGQLAAS